MGRRGVSIHDDDRWVFNRLVNAYRKRPGYPDGLVARLVELAGGPPARIVELGAGTGHLAIPLARSGLRVDAVEPARAMLEVLSAEAPGGLRPIHAAAEDTGLDAGAYRLVVLADALQWVDPERAGAEIHRLLAPGGTCAIVEPRWVDTPFLRALESMLLELNPKARRSTSQRARQLLSLATGGAPVHREEHLHDVWLDDDGLEAVLRSLSYVGPALGEKRLPAALDRARALAQEHGGARWRRIMTLSWASRRANRDARRRPCATMRHR